MTLNEAKTFLDRNRIPYHTAQYENEAEYWHHCMPFSRGENAKNCRVTALVIPAVNGVKDIELQFNRHRGEYEFQDLWFGGYSFEMFDALEDFLEADILEIIGQIVDGKLAVIESYDLKKKRWRGDSCFDLTDDDDVFGAPGYREALAKIEAPKTLWQKLTGKKLQYDIYDWRTHRQVVK
jgi:hypothetical protein